MEGQIGVESEPGRGSTFWFTARFEKIARPPSPSIRRADWQGLRVLVVDDNATNRMFLQDELSAWGFRNDSVSDAAQALRSLRAAALENDPYCLAVLDLMMPEMDGLALAREIKGDPSIRGVKLIMLTSLDTDGIATQAQEIGVLACMTKPVRQSQLYNCLAAVLGAPLATSPGQPVEGPSAPVGPSQFDADILLAEDNPVNQEVTRCMLEELGCRVDIAVNGRMALQAITRKSYDIVFMDCQMPEMDGFQATQTLREREKSCPEAHHVPIVAVTANAMKGDRERCLAAGMDDYLGKPFNIEQLRAALTRCLGGPSIQNGGEPSVRSAPEPAPPAAASSSPLDTRALDQIRALQGNRKPDLLLKVIRIYLESSPDLVCNLHEAVDRKDAAALQRVAHTLKSSSANLGASAMAALCKELEEMGRTKELGGSGQTFVRLEAEYKQVREALEALLKRSKP